MELRLQFIALSLFLATIPSFVCAASSKTGLPTGIIPDAVGVNIHFTDPRPGEMEMLAKGGFGWIRMDFTWGETEKEKGRYDFSAYERLLRALEPHGIRALFILDYSNPLYDNDLSPYTDEGRKAFARWAAAAAKHFAGKGILWEMYNEPNIGFWRPRPNPDDYIALAVEVGEAIRQAAPQELYVGPATSGVDFSFLENCFKAGLLRYWDAVTVHPYRNIPPETVIPEYTRLRELIARYAPKGKKIPILSGEWGYTDLYFTVPTQGQYLPRQWLINLFQGVPLSIWYDWHDDGPDPKEGEHHFGTVFFPYHDGRQPVYDPKPSYIAAQTLAKTLLGFRFKRRLSLDSDEDYCLLFTRGNQVRLAVWSTRKDPGPVRLPVGKGKVTIFQNDSSRLEVTANDSGLVLKPQDAPLYLIPQNLGALLKLAASWSAVPHEIPLRAGQTQTIEMTLTNPLSGELKGTLSLAPPASIKPLASARWSLKSQKTRKIRLTFPWTSRTSDPVPMVLSLKTDGHGQTIRQNVTASVINALCITPLPLMGNLLPVSIENPSGQSFEGKLVLEWQQSRPLRREIQPFHIKTGQVHHQVTFPWVTYPFNEGLWNEYRAGFRVLDRENRLVLRIPPKTFQLQEDFSRYPVGAEPEGYRLHPDGDPKVASEIELRTVHAPFGLPGVALKAARIRYRFDDGWKFLRMAPDRPASLPLEGKPVSVGMWVYGDGTSNLLRCRFVDATGQTFQPDFGEITWSGWKYVTASLDGKGAGYWGGANDGKVHYPVRWNSPVLIDSKGGKKTEGVIYVTGITVVR